MDVEHFRRLELWLILPRMNAVNRTYVHARAVLRADAGFANDVSQNRASEKTLSAYSRLLNCHPPRETIRVAVVVRDAAFGIAPAVVADAVVEVDEPESFRLGPERLELIGPAAHDVAQRRRECGMLRIVFRNAMELRGQRFGLPHRIGGHELDLGQERLCLLQRKDVRYL